MQLISFQQRGTPRRGEGGHVSASPSRRLILHRHRERAEQVVRKLRVGELEVALVVELEQGRRVRVLLLQVQVVHFRLVRRVAALLAHVHLLEEEGEKNDVISCLITRCDVASSEVKEPGVRTLNCAEIGNVLLRASLFLYFLFCMKQFVNFN